MSVEAIRNDFAPTVSVADIAERYATAPAHAAPLHAQLPVKAMVSINSAFVNKTKPAADGIGRIKRVTETAALAHREIKVAGRKRLKIVSYFDGEPGYDALTEKVDEGRKEQYKRHHLWRADVAKDPGPIRGENVEILPLLDPETNNPVASLRKVHVDAANVTQLPSYAKFEEVNALSAAGVALLHKRAAGRPVVEIAGLWKDPSYGTDTKLALYRAAIQDSVAKNELWFMGIVSAEYADLRRTYGERVVHTIGSAIFVHDGAASETLRLRPVVIDPSTLYDDLMEEARAAADAGDKSTRISREIMLWYFLDGLNWRHLNANTVQRLEGMRNGYID